MTLTRIYVVGIEVAQGVRRFRVIMEEETSNNGANATFKYKKFSVSEPELAAFVTKNLKYGSNSCINMTVTQGNRIKMTHGSDKRYIIEPGKPVNIILAEVRNANNKDNILGYRIATSDGNVKKVLLKECLQFGYKKSVSDECAFANAQFVSKGKTYFFRSYMSSGFPHEYISVNRVNPHAQKTTIDKKQNEQAVKKLTDIFTKGQLIELKKAKEHGVDIRIIGNPKLTDTMMHEIWVAEAKGLPGRLYADPKYSEQQMAFFRTELETKGDIRCMLNPAYSLEQLFELSTAYLKGVDINKVANPKYSAEKMSQIIKDEANKLWKEYKVIEGSKLV